MKILLLCALLLGGCAAKTIPLPLEDIPPLQAQFGMLFTHAGVSIPLQGAVRMMGSEGNIGVIFPHGLTLGICRYQEGEMECMPAGGEKIKTRFMLQRIGLAVYRMLPALAQEYIQDITDTDWSVRWKQADMGRKATYQDLAGQVTLDMHFTEITRP